jgi:hypothetical protein
MKVLSIIGIIVSLVAICLSYGVFTFRVSWDCGSGTIPPAKFPTEFSLTLLYTSIFFLCFSIISTIMAFKKKKGNISIDVIEKESPKE